MVPGPPCVRGAAAPDLGPTDEIDEIQDVCRRGTHVRTREAIQAAAART
ncbi:hypothetical protein GCM10027261_15870 [Geodermatophilus arenarius]|uniref:Uncharacterized protein n=1 Tax=Geodermatophilus arenarius TaxID=1137990 RepID=A0ABV9LJN2_9ACTN